MAHIDLGVDEHTNPGIFGLVAYRPETGRPLMQLANTLLHEENSLSPGDRELIAAYVSTLNDCEFCSGSHSAFAAAQLEGGAALVEQVKCDIDNAPVSDKMRSLLAIAAAVQLDGRSVTTEMVAQARAVGATEIEIHDTVLIAAAFCMYNRYVDGLGTVSVDYPKRFDEVAPLVAAFGYRA